MTAKISMDDIIEIIKKEHKTMSKETLLLHLEDFCSKNEIKLSKENINDNTVGRIILSGDGVGCGAAVICTETWKLVSYPHSKLITQFSVDDVKEFDAYKITDGTIISLYYYGGEWCIATTNGYDVSNITWIGDKSFAHMLARSSQNLSRICCCNRST